MLRVDISDLLFSQSFLEIKYFHQAHQVMQNIHKKYTDGWLSFLDVDERNDIKRIQEYVQKKKNAFESIVVLGIWGSALGTKAIFQAIKWKYYNELSRKQRWDFPKLYVLDNVDPSEIQSLLAVLDLEKTLFMVISKSWSTLETISQYKFFSTLIKQKWLVHNDHFVVIAWENSTLKKEFLKQWGEVFDIPEGIWGRFSAFTNVWLLPLCFVWIDIEQLLLWVNEGKESLFSYNIAENKALLTALIQYHSYIELGKNISVFFPYASHLSLLWDRYKQMIGESLGKLWIGVTLTNALWVTDQHSQLQLYYDGPNDKMILFLEVEDFGIDYPILDNRDLTFAHLMKVEKIGTALSMNQRNKIHYTLKIDALNEKTLWELVVFFEMQTAILWEIYGFDAFDQPGVEIGKKITKEKIEANIWKLNLLESLFND